MLDNTAGKDRARLWLELLGGTPMKFGAAAGASAVTLGIKMTDDTARALAKAPTTWREATELHFLMTHAQRQAHQVDKTSARFEAWAQEQMFTALGQRQAALNSSDRAASTALEARRSSGAAVPTAELADLLARNGAQPDEIAWLEAVQQVADRAAQSAAGNSARARVLLNMASHGFGTKAPTPSVAERLAEVEFLASQRYLDKVLAFLMENSHRVSRETGVALDVLWNRGARTGLTITPELADDLFALFRQVATPAERLAAEMLQRKWEDLRAALTEIERLNLPTKRRT